MTIENNGGRPGGIETRSIDYVPFSERHGKTWHNVPFWFTGNFNFFTVAIGFVGPGLGLGFFATSLASIAGILFGTVFMAFHASQGPDLGLPQMVQSRAQFGYRGVVIPLVGTLFTFVGFNVVDTVLISQGLNGLLGWWIGLTAVALSVIAVVIAIYGHDWLHIVFRVLFWVSLPFYIALSVAIYHGTIVPHETRVPSFTWVAFAAQFAAGASYNITFAPYVSDYTRYLPRGRSRLALLASVYFGASLSAIWLIVIGAWLASYLAANDGMAAINTAGNLLFRHGGTVIVLVSVAALIAAMALNAYSGMLTLITAIDSFRKVTPTRALRVVCICVLAVVWLAIALSVNQSAIGLLYDALTLMLYLLVPWTAINLVDYFLIRRGRYATAEFFKAEGIYGAWAWRGIAAYLIGLGVSIPFFNLSGIYEGPIAQALGGVDIAWAPGLLVAGGLFYTLMRSVNVSDENSIIEASIRLLEPDSL
jgi:nucleobase:cation symporter-1, NCS1 family